MPTYVCLKLISLPKFYVFFSQDKTFIDFSNNIQINWFFYSLETIGPVTQSEHDEDEAETVISTQLCLPSASLLSLWENLYYDADIKHNVGTHNYLTLN